MITFLGVKKHKLTVIEEKEDNTKSPHEKFRLVCNCECGNVVELNKYTFGRQKSCGCFRKEAAFEKAASRIGQKIHRLTLVSYQQNFPSYRSKYTCLCECGNTISVGISEINSGNTKSCGCWQKDQVKKTGLNNRTFQKSSISRQYWTYVGNAKSRGWIPLNQEEWFKIASEPCVYCGEIDIRKGVRSHRKAVKSEDLDYSEEDFERYKISINGIDRIDNTQGYIEGNMVPCCGWCNTMKRERTHTEFILKIEKIYNNLSPSLK